jgi:hypothetical protein
MPVWSWFFIAAAVLIAITLATAVVLSVRRRRRTERLKGHFGPEYERAIDEAGDQRAAEAELVAREKDRKKLDIVALSPEAHAKYAEEWRQTQSAFVDDPDQAVGAADRLVTEVMRECGYPIDGFEQRAAGLSVDHPDLVEHYRAAHVLHLAQEKGDIGTEAQREAIIHYRALFEKLLTTQPETPSNEPKEAPA